MAIVRLLFIELNRFADLVGRVVSNGSVHFVEAALWRVGVFLPGVGR